jgi:hypothetical protein
MRTGYFKILAKATATAACVLLIGAAAAFGQQTVNLIAQPTSLSLPDGSTVPMWGYSCGVVVAPNPSPMASCAPLNPNAPLATTAAPAGWSPVVITVPTGQPLTINLTNLLTFTPAATTANAVPTSLIIVGQVGGGLGTVGAGCTGGATCTASPAHVSQPVTWSTTNAGAEFTPPIQGPRVQSFTTEVAPGTTTALTWAALRAGTYLLESGTHPSIQVPMGLYGVLVVTAAPGTSAPLATATAGCAYPGAATGACAVTYNSELPLELSEVDPVLNNAINAAVNTAGFSETAARDLYLQPGPVVSMLVLNGGSGYASAPTVTFSGGVGSGASATANINSSGQVTSFTITNGGSGYTSDPSVILTGGGGAGATAEASLALGTNSIAHCSGGAAACYPPAANYTPLYYLVNGVAFDKTNSSASRFPPVPGTALATPPGNVLVRLVNAGLRMHVPAMVGPQTMQPIGTSSQLLNGFAIMAEDGNLAPGVPKVQSDVFMAAGKTYDVLINEPTGGVSAIPIAVVGSGYNVGNTSVIISGGGGSGARATPTIVGGVITAINITSAGRGYTSPPTVAIVDSSVAPLIPGSGATTGTPLLNAGTVAAFDRQLSLSGNAISRDAGMLAYISVNGGLLPNAAVLSGAVANPDSYSSIVPGQTLTVSDPSTGVVANDVNVYGVRLFSPPNHGTVSLNANGTFSYTPDPSWTATTLPITTQDTFVYQANGTGPTATVTLSAATIEASTGITCAASSYTASTATYLAIKPPGVLAGCTDAVGYPLTLATSTVAPLGGLTIFADPRGGFTASVPGAGPYSFTFQAQNSQGTLSSPVLVTITFPPGSGLAVTVLDGKDKTTMISDYRWIIEEDRTFYIDPACMTNPPAATCPTASILGQGVSGIVPVFGTNFHTSYMPYVAQGCTGPLSCEGGQTVFDASPSCTSPGVPAGCSATAGQHINAVCDIGSGVCRVDPTGGSGLTQVLPSQVALDPSKHYYISVLPGDAANPFYNASPVGHTMGGAPIAYNGTAWISPGITIPGQSVQVFAQPTPLPPSTLSVFVFEDDFPLNGEQDAGGGIDVLASNEPGLGGFQIHLWDAMGASGDFTGQMSYDMFNQPLSNSLAGTPDPATGLDACPVSKNPRLGANDPTQSGITGMIVTCPRYESDGKTLSPLAGQAVIKNIMPMRLSVIATPGADRIARGEEWLQTNTLDGQKGHDAFLRIGEPNYFQEFGPASYHVIIGFANPAIINARKPLVCSGNDNNLPGATNCTNSIIGKVTSARVSRAPDERLYSSGSHDAFYWSQCYVSLGDPDGEDFAFAKCAADGTFSLTGLPDGDWRVTVFDQWNDLIVDGLSTPVRLSGGKQLNIGDIASMQWQANVYTRTFIDENKDGLSQANEAGIPLIPVAVRYRDGSLANGLLTDFNGTANFNETFPLFSWYAVETDTTRYKNTGTHVVYDAGGPADGCGGAVSAPCGNSVIGKYLANTAETVSLPTNLRVPGAVYCMDADCNTHPTGIQGGPGSSDPPSSCSTTSGVTTCSPLLSTGRIDPPWVRVEGWQGFSGQNNFLEFGKTPYVPGENGGIKGHVIYASTRPFDDPQLLVQTQWEPLVPHVTINLYREGLAGDNVTPTLKLVDSTQTSSWDDWAQGFRSDGVPNMNCPGQSTTDLFYFSLYNQPNYLNWYNAQHGGPAMTPLPYNSQFKCYDGMHNWNQLQPAPYDGMYKFPSVLGINPTTGAPVNTNCTICSSNPTDGTPMLPSGKYVVEVVPPPGFELVKEEDKNILIGDNYIAPVTQEFGGLANIFIIPDQASVAAQGYPGPGYNANSAQNPTQSFGANPENGIVPGFVPEPVWPCVGEARVVPDYISLFPQSKQVAPFAGAIRNLCDRKEVTLNDQMGASAKFFLYTSTHIASKFTGVITDDFTSEFDPFSPQFGEKFSPPDLPVSIKDWTGTEISRVYADHWGTYNGMTYSTWEVNPPNPTGYSPTMMIFCMNDPGAGTTPDPLFNSAYSQFCYELPYMPGTTDYLDTPVVPTSAFAGAGYSNPDCNYPDGTPTIKEVDGDGKGPWVSAVGHTITIASLGPQTVSNYGYTGPSATTAPFNQKTITRNYGFGPAPSTCPATGVCPNVTVGAQALTNVTWSDGAITGTLPSTVPVCPQQQAQYSGVPTQCGELVITAANGKQSIDTVTVTIENKSPTHVTAGGSIQTAIDAAAPGDLIIVDPGVYNEMLLMWKPVRLQGVGAASSVINANAHPAGKLDPWRAKVNCLFGLALNGQPYSTAGNLVPLPGFNIPGNPNQGKSAPLNAYDATGAASCPAAGWNYFGGGPNNPQVDRVPLEGFVGWDTTVNGNLAQLLQEPSLMGAYEGAGITVLAKGVRYPPGVDIFGTGLDTTLGSIIAHEGQFPEIATEGTNLLMNRNEDCLTQGAAATGYSSNFLCNPSRIDGLSVTNSSQGGGGIYVHGWAHDLGISNNRVYNNTGTMTGGITVGQGESPDAIISGNGGDPVAGDPVQPYGGFDQQPWTCVPGSVTFNGIVGVQNAIPPGFPAGTQLPYCYNVNVNVHNNAVTKNSSIGDEVFSGTPAGAGGVTFCTGSDYYQFNYNWVCGNLSTGDGGGLAHIGFNYQGDIEHNTILFNQSTNPTIATNGGGIIVTGAAPDGATATQPECGSVTDVDCAPGLSDGTGPGLVINANLILGNAAESGSGGGIRFQDVNGTDVGRFPNGSQSLTRPEVGPLYGGPGGLEQRPTPWNDVLVTNNVIANNVAGWDGAGASFQDALAVKFINNTVVSNDSTASAGPLFNTLGAPLASAPGPTCTSNCGSASPPQAAGLVTMANTSLLSASLKGVTVTCPTGNGTNGNCSTYSVPLLENDVFWQNRSFYIAVGQLGTGTQNQQNVVALYDAFTTTQALTQPTTASASANGTGTIITGGTGACVSPVSYWDIGVRGDKGPSDHSSGLTLAPKYSVITDAGDYLGGNNLADNPEVLSQYCNGSRTPPEFNSLGYQVPPGIADATVPNPIFNLTPTATVDEGNNWINMSWGPLSLVNPVTGATLGNYALASTSSALDYVPVAAEHPATDFFGNPRPTAGNAGDGRFDVGAVEFQNTAAEVQPTLVSITPASAMRGTSVNITLTGSGLSGTSSVNAPGSPNISISNVAVVSDTTVTATLTLAPVTALGAHNVTVTARGLASNAVTFTVLGATLGSIAPNTGARGKGVNVTLTGTNLSTVTAVNVPAGSGINVSNVVASSTTVTATLTISATTALGGYAVNVTTTGGAISNNVIFSVVSTSVVPTLNSITPNARVAGSPAFTVTLTGSGLSGATAVNTNAANIIVSNVQAVNDNTVTATFTVTGPTVPGAKNVTVTTPTVNTNAVTFTVTRPTLTSITPNAGLAGSPAFAVTLSGSGLTGTTAVTTNAPNITVSNVQVVNDSTVTALFTVTGPTAAGARNVSTTNSGGATSNNVTFTVNRLALSTISVPSGVRGTVVPVTLTGTNLTGSTTVNAGAGITVSGVSVNAAGTAVTATLTIASGTTAALGPRTMSVTNAGGATSNTVTFTVLGPTLTSISTASATRPATGTLSVPVTLTGTNLTGATGLTGLGNGVSIVAGTFTVVNSTTVTATLSISSTATTGARNIAVTTGIGNTSTVAFTVN